MHPVRSKLPNYRFGGAGILLSQFLSANLTYIHFLLRTKKVYRKWISKQLLFQGVDIIPLMTCHTELIFLLPRTPAKQKERYPGFPEEFLFWPQIAGNRFRDSTEICFPQIKTKTNQMFPRRAELFFDSFETYSLHFVARRRVTLFLLSCLSKY